MIELRTTNARGALCGESQPMCRWPDALVAEARALRARGMTIYGITAQLNGPHHSTVWRWVAGITRKPPARVIARRVKTTPTSDSESAVNPLASTTYSLVRNFVSNAAPEDDFSDLA